MTKLASAQSLASASGHSRYITDTASVALERALVSVGQWPISKVHLGAKKHDKGGSEV
jgi:hypothetical protein